MELGLSNKVALVAASSKGLGRAIAEALAAEGAALALCARHADTLAAARDEIARTTRAPVHAVAADLAQAEGIERVTRSTLERFGRVDVLVTNNGGPPIGVFERHDWAAWQRACELTLRSAVELTRAALPGMRERRWGRIIHVTSLTVKQPIDGLMLSTSIRSALTGLSRTLANEVAADGITVNTILPGFMNTERVAEVNEAAAAREGISVSEVERRTIAQIPMRRIGEPRELAAMAAFLASERAAYITGQSIVVDGGWVRALM
ncbi:MAG TPA: SDR family oxidoreductase [Candidatus Eisenbacteria bacterium]|nr:SDR family oxidoreductase [Candidatus Eisenbacteria bacterium]